jgi:hypothetical protein
MGLLLRRRAILRSEYRRKGLCEEAGVRYGVKTVARTGEVTEGEIKEAAALTQGSSFERRQLPLKQSQKSPVQKYEEKLEN